MLITGTCLAVTAVLAGLTGTWSPCGLSSVDTLGTGLGRSPRRGRTTLAVLAFTVAATAGGALTFGAAGALGAAAGLGGHLWAAALAALVALAAGVADLRFLAIVPQIRRQVPEAVRWRLPLPVTAAAYGLLLGLGFTTYLLTYAMWALLAACVLLGDPVLGVVVGATFGVGRALPVAVLVPRFATPETQRFIADMERGPTLIGLRRIDGVALLACALAVVPVAVAEAAARTVHTGAADPSDAAGAFAFQDAGGRGVLVAGDGVPITLPGTDPAVGAGRVAWRAGDVVTVADAGTLIPVLTAELPGVQELALSATDLVYRRATPEGVIVGAQPLTTANPPRVLYRGKAGIVLGRPSVSEDTVLFAITSRRTAGRIVSVPLAGGAVRTVRRAPPGSQIPQAALYEGRVLYVRTTRCAQELRHGRLAAPAGRDRTVLRLRAPAVQDGGFQRGFPDAYNAASKCPRRPVSAARGVLWTTALGPGGAYVTRLARDGRGAPVILRVPLGAR